MYSCTMPGGIGRKGWSFTASLWCIYFSHLFQRNVWKSHNISMEGGWKYLFKNKPTNKTFQNRCLRRILEIFLADLNNKMPKFWTKRRYSPNLTSSHNVDGERDWPRVCRLDTKNIAQEVSSQLHAYWLLEERLTDGDLAKKFRGEGDKK